MVTRTDSLYWFDYETFGISPAWDRPSQFAGVRTDLALNQIGDPLTIYCRLPGDYLPSPEACLITGIGPDEVAEKGLAEAAFIEQIRREIGFPGTCHVGYNSVRFDDEFTRHALFRNFHDPYEHEWKDGNSRWDLLDVVRLTRALRPDGIQWPYRDDGAPSNRLEHLTALNGIEHASAHDALSDVRATIAVARLIRDHQPRLFDYVFAHRDKHSIAELLDVKQRTPVILIAGTLPAARSHLAIVLPLARHPANRNGVIVLDLNTDPDELANLDAEEIARRVFSPGDSTRLGIHTVQINKCPVVVPLNTLRPEDATRLGIDPSKALANAIRAKALLDDVRSEPSLATRVGSAMTREWENVPVDVDGSLYGGEFLSGSDKTRLADMLATPSEGLAAFAGHFEDPRLDEMLFRYRARNFPVTLDQDEQELWREDCLLRLTDEHSPWMTFAKFRTAMDACQWDESTSELRDSLERLLKSVKLNLDD